MVHPFDPLSPDELTAAVAIVRQYSASPQGKWGSRLRFPCVALKEPTREQWRGYGHGDPVTRQAWVVVLDSDSGCTWDVVVSLDDATIISAQLVTTGQANVMADELSEAEAAIKADPGFQAALHQRGITDLELVMVDPWAVGHFGTPEDEDTRLLRGYCWLRATPNSNAYARPIEGLLPWVNAHTMEVIRIEDYGPVPVPPQAGEYAQEFQSSWRTDLKPLQILQPQGASFQVDGHQISWQKWQFRFGFHPREGLILYDIRYQDGDRLRPIIHRASLAEMVVPYGDPRPQHYRKNAFDVGEHGVGLLANSLHLGCDCLGEVRYFDAHFVNSYGEVFEIPQAICLHEEDNGILWKHFDWRRNHVDVRRGRRLVISFISTVDNYEYAFYWYFYQDGTLEYEVKLTGILLCGALGEVPDYGTLVAPELNAINHQHFFCMRLDMQVDGFANSVYEVNTEAVPMGSQNPQGNAFRAKATLLARETEAQRDINPLTARYWKVVNPTVTNALGQTVAYKLIPGENVLPFAHADSSLMRRAGFLAHHLWVTPYDPQEQYPAGNFPNQHPGGEGLPRWTEANRSIDNTDLVVWYCFGHHHIPRPEDWPVMPVSKLGFMLKPLGFFHQNPALDVPPSRDSQAHSCH
ncbi:MAG: primary-amine oxidase [Synechococcales cyanobacterium]